MLYQNLLKAKELSKIGSINAQSFKKIISKVYSKESLS